MANKPNYERTMMDLKRENETLKIELKDKEQECFRLKQEKTSLEEEIKMERAKNKKFEPATSNGSSNGVKADEGSGVLKYLTFGLAGSGKQDDYTKLNQNYLYLKKQYETATEKLKRHDDIVDSIRSQLKEQIEKLEYKLNVTSNDLEIANETVDKQKEQIRSLKIDNEKSVTTNVSLMKEKVKLEEEIRKLRSHFDNVSEENSRMSRELAEQSELIQGLNKSCSAFEQEVIYLRDKTNAFDFYSVKRQGTKLINPIPCLIIMRKNVLGEYMIELENPGEKLILQPSNVMACEVLNDATDRFKFSYRIKGKMENEIFIVDNPTKLSEALSTFINMAKKHAKGTNGNESSNKKEKNLISEFVGFFGS
jgi:predicted  nucleic acid-binding Zn-ribbon protein